MMKRKIRKTRRKITKSSIRKALRVSIGELSEKTGVSRRNIRYYVQRGLIDPPVGLGRTAGYSKKHIQQLVRVLYMKRGGVRLDVIKDLPDGIEIEPVQKPPRAGAPLICMRIQLVDNVVLEFQASEYLPSRALLNKMAEECARILKSSRRRG